MELEVIYYFRYPKNQKNKSKMHSFFIAMYRFVERKKRLAIAIAVALLCFFGFFATQIQFEEDITRIIPKSEKSDVTAKVLQHLLQKSRRHPSPQLIIPLFLSQHLHRYHTPFLQNLIGFLKGHQKYQ